MPRKTKEQKELELKKEDVKKSTTKKTKTTSTKAASKSSSTKKTTSASKKSSLAKKSTTSAEKKASATTKKKSTTSKKSATSKAVTKKTAKANKATKATKTTRKTAKAVKSKKEKVEVVEYYDLPYRYNQTVVKVLAQTPTNLFIYWDISDKDRKIFEEKYGEDFFEKTRPVLIVYNDTIGYSFEVEINDFANSWYLNVADSKCDYRVELGRKTIEYTPDIPDNYVYISTSNEIESPNDHILFNKNQQMVYFRNVKTGEQIPKPLSSMSFIRNMGKIYNIYDMYKAIYENENIDDMRNPSSRKFFFKILVKINF